MSKLSMDNVASTSHDMYVHRTMFTKPVISHTYSVSRDKGANQSIPTCHHCRISGHIRLNCFQLGLSNLGTKDLSLEKKNQVLKNRLAC
jgi:hypothetical protein